MYRKLDFCRHLSGLRRIAPLRLVRDEQQTTLMSSSIALTDKIAKASITTTSQGINSKENRSSGGANLDIGSDGESINVESFTGDIIQGPSLLRTSMSRRHRPQPTVLHLPGLRSIPFWSQLAAPQGSSQPTTRIAYNDPEISSAVRHMEQNFDGILEEFSAIRRKQDEEVKLTNGTNDTRMSDYNLVDAGEHEKLHTGGWDWRSYMLKGEVQQRFVESHPILSGVLQGLRETGSLFEGTPFGYCFLSDLHPGSRIRPHCGPVNFRVRVHLPLIVPDDSSRCGIRVGPIVRQWTIGKALVFDDSYEHETWNDVQDVKEVREAGILARNHRVIMLVDLWHPDVTMRERQDIIKMFQHARQQGWWSPDAKGASA